MSVIEILGYVFGFLWPFWPLIFLRAVVNIFGNRSRRTRRSVSQDLLAIWGFLALGWIAAAVFLNYPLCREITKIPAGRQP